MGLGGPCLKSAFNLSKIISQTSKFDSVVHAGVSGCRENMDRSCLGRAIFDSFGLPSDLLNSTTGEQKGSIQASYWTK